MKLTKEEIRCQIKSGIIVGCLFLMLLLSGCVTETRKEFFPDGKVKSEYKYKGCIKLSDGDGKVVNTPLSHVSGVSVGK